MLKVAWIYDSRLLVVKLLTQETAVNKNNLLYTVVGRDRKEAKEDQLWMNENGCNT